MSRKRKNPKLPRERETYAIIVDGETEVWYFQMLKRNERTLQVHIEPKIPQKKKLSEQYEKVCEACCYYTKVFWIIDIDVIARQNKERELKEYIDAIEKEYKNIVIILNNPCLEFWFLLHFESTTKYFSECSDAEKHLNKHLKDYEKTKKYFTKENADIYLKLKQYLQSAIKNAKTLQRKNLDKLNYAICEMNLFFEDKQIKNKILNTNYRGPQVNL